MSEPITEEWLAEVGFRWERLERQPAKHWILWLGQAVREPGWNCYSIEDLGVEVAQAAPPDGRWHCWVRADYAGRYSRFVHVRTLRERGELTALVAALTGFPFDPANAKYGAYHRPDDAAWLREYGERLEVEMAEAWARRVLRETGQDPHGREKVKP